MSRTLKSRKSGNNFVFRDRDASPAEGVSLWETFPSLAHLCDPASFHEYFNDFHNYVAGDWTVTDAGTNTVAVTDEAGGVLLLTTGATENNGPNLNKKGEAFKLASGKALWYEARLKVGEATESDFLIGLSITDTDMLGAVTDGVYFRKVDGSTTVAFVTEKDSSETSTNVHTAVAATYVKLGFWFDGSGAIYAYVNGVLAATHTATIPDDEDLCVAFQYLAGSAGAKTMSIDYIKVVQVR